MEFIHNNQQTDQKKSITRMKRATGQSLIKRLFAEDKQKLLTHELFPSDENTDNMVNDASRLKMKLSIHPRTSIC
jgi:hypothetical protein